MSGIGKHKVESVGEHTVNADEARQRSVAGEAIP